MTPNELTELGYIVPINTVQSILERGLLSHNRVSSIAHTSIALPEVQALRAAKVVPNGRPLHDYVNLYICPRNPMMSSKRAIHMEICVLRVDPSVINLQNVVISNSNAGGKYVNFEPAPDGLAIVDRARTFARNWKHPDDQIDEWRHSAQKCAEVLVPDVVPSRFVVGAYVSCDESHARLKAVAPDLPIQIDADLFFR